MKRKFLLSMLGLLSSCLVLPFATCSGSAINGLVQSFKPCDVLNCENAPYFDPCVIFQCSRPGHTHVVGDGQDSSGTGDQNQGTGAHTHM